MLSQHPFLQCETSKLVCFGNPLGSSLVNPAVMVLYCAHCKSEHYCIVLYRLKTSLSIKNALISSTQGHIVQVCNIKAILRGWEEGSENCITNHKKNQILLRYSGTGLRLFCFLLQNQYNTKMQQYSSECKKHFSTIVENFN